MNIKNITAVHLQKTINEISSYSAQKKIHQMLNEIFDMLHKMNLIRNNPMTIVVVPKQENKNNIPSATQEQKILSFKQEKKLIERTKNSPCHEAIILILYSGLRRGECIGLQWKHINFEENTITINQQWNESTKKISSTKSKAGNRTIPIFPQALKVLKKLYNENNHPEDFVFKNIKRLTQQLVYYSSKLDFRVNPHMLRHTFASRCYFAGLDPKILQVILGHESINTTLNTYTHLVDQEDDEVINEIKNNLIQLKLIKK